jgi:hypothetical protein
VRSPWSSFARPVSPAQVKGYAESGQLPGPAKIDLAPEPLYEQAHAHALAAASVASHLGVQLAPCHSLTQLRHQFELPARMLIAISRPAGLPSLPGTRIR